MDRVIGLSFGPAVLIIAISLAIGTPSSAFGREDTFCKATVRTLKRYVFPHKVKLTTAAILTLGLVTSPWWAPPIRSAMAAKAEAAEATKKAAQEISQAQTRLQEMRQKNRVVLQGLDKALLTRQAALKKVGNESNKLEGEIYLLRKIISLHEVENSSLTTNDVQKIEAISKTINIPEFLYDVVLTVMRSPEHKTELIIPEAI